MAFECWETFVPAQLRVQGRGPLPYRSISARSRGTSKEHKAAAVTISEKRAVRLIKVIALFYGETFSAYITSYKATLCYCI